MPLWDSVLGFIFLFAWLVHYWLGKDLARKRGYAHRFAVLSFLALQGAIILFVGVILASGVIVDKINGVNLSSDLFLASLWNGCTWLYRQGLWSLYFAVGCAFSAWFGAYFGSVHYRRYDKAESE